jgi:hypothetical protein
MSGSRKTPKVYTEREQVAMMPALARVTIHP